MRAVDVHFDYSSPYAYLGVSQIERIARETGAEVRWRPFLLGALFRAIGTPLVPIHEMPVAKRRYQRVELSRWAERWGVPFQFNSHFPLRTVDALRLTLIAPEEKRSALIARLMRGAWAQDEDLAERSVLEQAASEVGLPASLAPRVSNPETKALLQAATDAAIAAGIPGAPSFVVGGEIYWGQDRLQFVEAALRGRPPGISRA